MKSRVLLDYELSVAQAGYTVRAMLSLEGKAPVQEGTRIPLNVSIVLDRSGSMAGEKLHAARGAAAMLVRRLHPDDLASVVTYDDNVSTIAEPGAAASQHGLVAAIEAVESGGNTNLSGGWLRGHELVARNLRSGASNRVVLLTDGLANRGITDPTRLVEMCRNARSVGVATTTIGFGSDYDEKLLRAMADAGGANTYYIERPDQAMGVFEEELQGLLTLSAQNVVVTIRPGPDVRMMGVRHRYPERIIANGVTLDIGDVYAREPRAVLVEFFVPGLDRVGDVSIAQIEVTAQVLTDAGGVERQVLSFPINSVLSPRGQEEPEIRREMLLLDAARAREEALLHRERGDMVAAGAAFRHAASAIAAAPPPIAASPVFMELRSDLEELAGRIEDDSFDEADAKYAAQRAYNADRGKLSYEERLSRKPRP